MTRTTSVTLGNSLNEFIVRMIDSGRYGSTSEVMRSALRLLEGQENQQLMLKQALQEGLDSGESSLSLKDIAQQTKQRLSV